MPGIDVTRGLIAAGVGVADELVIDWDESVVPPRTEAFKTAKDLGRLGVVLAGYGLQMFMPRQSAIGDALATAATPLLVKSVWSAVAAGGTSGRRFVPNQQRIPNRAPVRSPGPARSRYPAPTYQNEFKNIRLT